MKKNIGKTDRIIRLIVAVIFAILYFTETVTGVWGTVLIILAAVMLLTAFIRFCPLYLPCRFSSCKKEE